MMTTNTSARNKTAVRPAIESSALSVIRDGIKVLDDVSISINPGEIVGIIGPNGAGKSTWIKAALGIIPATSGSLLLAGDPLAGLTMAERAKRIAYVPQERDVAWQLSVKDIVALGRLPHQSPFTALGATDHAAIQAAMADAKVDSYADRPVTKLSGGERARVLIARALAQSAPVLLADEPTSGLDPAHQLALLTLLRKRAAAGEAIGLSIHELHLAARWCDRLVLVHEGRVISDGAPRDVLTANNIHHVYGCEALISETGDGLIVVPLSVDGTQSSSERTVR